MNAAKHTPGPWKWDGASRIDAVAFRKPRRYVDDNGDEQVFMQGMVALPYSCGPGVTHEANALVMAAAPELLEALQWSEQFNVRPGEGYSECFERIAEVFHRETGHLRPGKDASPMAGASMDERHAAWEEWIAAGIARVRAAIAKATGGAS